MLRGVHLARSARTILEHGSAGVLAVHSISKRSNAAGLRVGFYAGDEELVHYLSELRKHAGFMVPTPIQAAGIVALNDDEQPARQRELYTERLSRMIEILGELGVPAVFPAGGFYLWVEVPERLRVGAGEGESPEWPFVRLLAEHAGTLVTPGEFFGPSEAGFVRIAMVEPLQRIELVGERLQTAITNHPELVG